VAARLAVAAVGAGVAGAGWRLYLLRNAERHSTLASEAAQLLTQSQVAARVLELEIEAASHALDMLLRGWPAWQPASAPQAAQTLQHLEDVLRVMPGTRSFTLLDRDGVVQLSTVAGLAGGNYAHRPYFQEIVRAVPQQPGQVFVSAPYQTTINRTWAVNVSRPVLDGQGQLQGVAVATLDPAFFSQHLAAGAAPDRPAGPPGRRGICRAAAAHTAGWRAASGQAAARRRGRLGLGPATFVHPTRAGRRGRQQHHGTRAAALYHQCWRDAAAARQRLHRRRPQARRPSHVQRQEHGPQPGLQGNRIYPRGRSPSSAAR
jgi:hypothetical protein